MLEPRVEERSPLTPEALLARWASDPRPIPRALVRVPRAPGGEAFTVACEDALAVVTVPAGAADAEVRAGGRVHRLARDPFDAIEALLARLPLRRSLGLPFESGLVGYLGYELGAPPTTPRHPAPDLWLAVPARTWVWPEATATTMRSTCVEITCGAGARDAVAAWLATEPGARLDGPASPRQPAHPRSPYPVPGLPGLRSDVDRDGFRRRFDACQAAIAAGEIYQANLSQRLAVDDPVDALALFRALESGHPAPASAYVDTGRTVLASNSPEQFVRRAGGRLSIRPIKGTRRRDPDPARDAARLAELRASAKDAAEHVMIVDLVRNDLGRVAEVGSVAVPALAAPEALATVHHLVSTVVATERPGTGLGELLRATFPCGSVTGAPKLRAIEVLRRLEPTPRGPYTGSIGLLEARGDVALNVAIRTAVLHAGALEYRTGGGIVADSTAEAEWDEALAKAEVLVGTLARLAAGAGRRRRAAGAGP